MTSSPTCDARELSAEATAVLQAELLAASITRAARIEAQRIVAAAKKTRDKRDSLVRRAESLNDEATRQLPPFEVTAEALLAEVRAAADERVREISAEAEREIARIEAATKQQTLALVNRVERRTARLERRHRTFRKQIQTPVTVTAPPSAPIQRPHFLTRQRTAITAVALAGSLATALVVFAPDFGGSESKAGASREFALGPVTLGPPVSCPIPATYRSAFTSAARRADIPVPLLGAVAEVESGFNPSARSEAGAQGMLQLMPATARMFHVNPLNVRQNIRGGASYLRYLHDRLGSHEAALAAYHAGPTARIGVGYGAETRQYVARVSTRWTAFEGCR